MEACKLSLRRRVEWTACGVLAGAWHRRVMADEVVGHAFSHGFHPQHVERLAAY
jgi:hemoglobin